MHRQVYRDIVAIAHSTVVAITNVSMLYFIVIVSENMNTNGVFFSTKKYALYFKKFNFVFVS